MAFTAERFALEKAWGCGLRALGRGSRPLRFAGVFVGAISAGVGTVLCFSLRGGPATTDPGAQIIGGLLQVLTDHGLSLPMSISPSHPPPHAVVG